MLRAFRIVKWFRGRSDAVRHFFVVTLCPEGRHLIIPVNDSSQIFDEIYQRIP